VLPLSTAYSVCEYAGVEAAVDDPFSEARLFYLTFGLVTLGGAIAVLIPNAPLVTILVTTQVLNAVLLVPLLVVMVNIGRDRDLMGRFTIGPGAAIAYAVTIFVVVLCVAALVVTSLTG
jgi:Mn2+/Fe2+ NRAMP family transporter